MLQIPRWQIVAVLVILLLGLAYALPNVLPRFDSEGLPGWVPHKTVNLGLDLKQQVFLFGGCIYHKPGSKLRVEGW